MPRPLPTRWPLPLVALVLAAVSGEAAPAPFVILVNHLGYDAVGPKKVVVQADAPTGIDRFQVVDSNDRTAFEGSLSKPEKVDRWKRWVFQRGEFSALDRPGSYRVRIGGRHSEPFVIAAEVLEETCLPDLYFYFKSQRSSGAWDRADRHVSLYGSKRAPVDVHGGWFDASGDVSKYLSHLSYANYLNQQGTPIVVWGMLEAAALLKEHKSLRLRTVSGWFVEEALYGADFLVRMQDPAGYFYMSVFDGWSWDPAKRQISAYNTQEGIRNANYQAGFREGGGVTIAALARAAALKRDGEYRSARYLAAAEKGFAHLQAHNLEYVDDHQENILDDYAALLAATELYLASHRPGHLQAARVRAESLVRRLDRDDRWKGYWRAGADGKRTFFHAVDAGLPVVALLRYADAEPEAARRQAALAAVSTSLAFELAVTDEVPNPFGYARQYVTEPGGARHTGFFFPHHNESGYWWQGENARLGSLSTAALLAARRIPERAVPLRRYAADQLDWILGLNPYDMCMLQGRGRRNPDLLPENPNAPGGVCNGITSGFADEHDIDFMPEPQSRDPLQNWRWAEQWLPHGAWLMLALSAQAAVLER
jgi:hypothetical protein